MDILSWWTGFPCHEITELLCYLSSLNYLYGSAVTYSSLAAGICAAAALALAALALAALVFGLLAAAHCTKSYSGNQKNFLHCI